MSIDWNDFRQRVPVKTVVKILDRGLLFADVGLTVGGTLGVLRGNVPADVLDPHAPLCVEPQRHTGRMRYESAICLHYWLNGQWMTFIQVMSLDALPNTVNQVET
jgi:hypothetical protein